MRALILIAALLAGHARADNTADEADVAFELGNRAYAKRDFSGALGSYFLSYRLVPNRNVLFNIARCYEAMGRLDEAYRYWNDLLATGLEGVDRADVQQALKRIAPKVALLSVVTQPPGAEIYLDRKDLGSRGRSPQTIAVTPGTHRLLLELEGHQTQTVKLTAVNGREANAKVSLERIVGTVSVVGSPEGAVVQETLEGPELGRVPALLALPPGRRLLWVTAPGYVPQQALVEVKGNETVAVRVVLVEKSRPTGKVTVVANRDDALIRIDGQIQGFTPSVLTLPAGRHALQVSQSEMALFEQEILVTPDEELRVDVVLRYAPPTVSATSKEQLTVDEAPASVTVVTREELRAFGYQSVPEVLQAVRGFFLSDDRIYTYVGVRGFQPPGDLNTRILVLWDGHPINDVWAGQAFVARDLDVDLSAIDRIEVVRGPASLLYGTGAFFGVINVVPRTEVGAARHVEAVAGAGGQNAVKGRAFGSFRNQTVALSLTGAGFLAGGAPLTELGDVVVRGMDGERAYGASTKMQWNGFTLLAKMHQRSKDIPTAPLGSQLGVPGTHYTDTRGFAELRYQKTWERLSVNARAAYDLSRYQGVYAHLDGEGNSYKDSDTGGADWLSLELRVAATLFEGNRLTASVEAQGQRMRQQSVASPQENVYWRGLIAGTLMDEWRVGSLFWLQAGIRVDKYFDLPELALSPRAGVVAKFYRGGTSKLIAGRAFRAPTIYERFFNDNNVTQRAPFTSPQPELVTSFEVEHSHDFTSELRVTVAGYFNFIDKLVVLSEDQLPTPLCGPLDAPVQCVVFGNSSQRMSAGGAEAEVRWQPGPWTLVGARYSWVYVNDATLSGNAYPMHVAALRAMAPLKEGLIRVSAQAVFQSGRRTAEGLVLGESLLIHAGFSGEYGAFRYFAGVQNLLDQRAVVPVISDAAFARVPQYGRTLFAEIGASF